MLNRRVWLGQVALQNYAPPPRRQPSRPAPRGLLGGASLGAAAALTDDTFNAAIKGAPMAIVDFWSPDCPYCVAYKPIFDEVAGMMGGSLPMYTVNVKDNGASPAPFSLGGIPATIFLVNGKEVHREEGNLSKADLLAAISTAFGSSAPAAARGGGIPTLGWVAGGLAVVGLGIFLATRG